MAVLQREGGGLYAIWGCKGVRTTSDQPILCGQVESEYFVELGGMLRDRIHRSAGSFLGIDIRLGRGTGLNWRAWRWRTEWDRVGRASLWRCSDVQEACEAWAPKGVIYVRTAYASFVFPFGGWRDGVPFFFLCFSSTLCFCFFLVGMRGPL